MLYMGMNELTIIICTVANWSKRRRERQRGRKFINPYDLGWKRNFQQIWGNGNALLAVMIPSSREPDFLPVPLAGDIGKRYKPKSKDRGERLASISSDGRLSGYCDVQQRRRVTTCRNEAQLV